MAQNATSNDTSTTEQIREGAAQVASSAKERAGQVGDEVKSQARRLTEEARAVARDRLEEQGSQLSSAAGRMSDDLRTMANSVDAGFASNLANKASETIDDFTRRFDEGGLDAIGREVTDFARRRPAMFLGGTLLLGVAMGRLFRNVDWHEVTGNGEGSDRRLDDGTYSRIDSPLNPTPRSAVGSSDEPWQPARSHPGGTV